MKTYQYDRADYMSGKCTHHEFYSQFVTPSIRDAVRANLGKRIKASTDEHLNDVPLHFWDGLAVILKSGLSIPGHCAGIGGDPTKRFFSLCTAVCILKAAGKDIKESA